MNTTQKAEKLQVTKAPKTRPAKTEYGVSTGMLVTKSDSVALVSGEPTLIPEGSLITRPLAGGHSQKLNAMCDQRKMGDKEIVYLA